MKLLGPFYRVHYDQSGRAVVPFQYLVGELLHFAHAGFGRVEALGGIEPFGGRCRSNITLFQGQSPQPPVGWEVGRPYPSGQDRGAHPYRVRGAEGPERFPEPLHLRRGAQSGPHELGLVHHPEAIIIE